MNKKISNVCSTFHIINVDNRPMRALCIVYYKIRNFHHVDGDNTNVALTLTKKSPGVVRYNAKKLNCLKILK